MREAETVIPKMIRAGDPMFRRENLFVALDGTKVAGVLLWIKEKSVSRPGPKGPMRIRVCVYHGCLACALRGAEKHPPVLDKAMSIVVRYSYDTVGPRKPCTCFGNHPLGIHCGIILNFVR